MTTTQKQLEGALKVLNCETTLNYSLEYGYKVINLYRQSGLNSYGTLIFTARSKGEMYQVIHAIRLLLLVEHQNKQTDFELFTKEAIKKSGYSVTCLQQI